MLPVLLWGVLVLKKNYGARDVLTALVITGGERPGWVPRFGFLFWGGEGCMADFYVLQSW